MICCVSGLNDPWFMQKIFFVTILVALACNAHALSLEDIKGGRWSVLGPAWSWHHTLDGARVTVTQKTQRCYAVIRGGAGSGEGVVLAGLAIPDYTGTELPTFECPASISADPAWQFGGQLTPDQIKAAVGTLGRFDAATLFSRTDAEESRRWHGSNPAFGIEYTFNSASRLAGWSVVLDSARDSYGAPSLMIGGARKWPVAHIAGFTVEAGLSGGLWNRSRQDSKRTTLPFVFPVMSAIHDIGLGVDVAVALPLQIRGTHFVPTTTVMIQSKFQFK